MTQQKPPSSEWISYIEQQLPTKEGTLKTTNDPSIQLEWQLIKAQDKRLNELINQSSDILVGTYVPMELQFAQEHPNLVSQEMFLKPIAHLFGNGVEAVDWNKAESELKKHLHSFFSTTDFAKFSGPNDLCIFVTAKDTDSGKRLGMIQFLITPEYEFGTAKAGLYGTLPHDTLDKLLMSSLFKIVPDVKRIFLHTRSTNEQALNRYRSWGFTKCEGPLEHWTDLEYKVNSSPQLQQTAEKLIAY